MPWPDPDEGPGLSDAEHGLWRLQTQKTTWIVDLDARVVRHEILGMDEVQIPGRAWILLRLRNCTIGHPLDWVLSGTPGGRPRPQLGEAEVVIDFAPHTNVVHRSTSPGASRDDTA